MSAHISLATNKQSAQRPRPAPTRAHLLLRRRPVVPQWLPNCMLVNLAGKCRSRKRRVASCRLSCRDVTMWRSAMALRAATPAPHARQDSAEGGRGLEGSSAFHGATDNRL